MTLNESTDSSILNCVVAFVRPFQVDAVADALRRLPNFPGLSVSESRGFGRKDAHPPRAGERAEVDPFTRMARLEIYCRDAQLSAIVDTIQESAHTGHAGDGKIFISVVAWAMDVRTGRDGPDILGVRG